MRIAGPRQRATHVVPGGAPLASYENRVSGPLYSTSFASSPSSSSAYATSSQPSASVRARYGGARGSGTCVAARAGPTILRSVNKVTSSSGLAALALARHVSSSAAGPRPSLVSLRLNDGAAGAARLLAQHRVRCAPSLRGPVVVADRVQNGPWPATLTALICTQRARVTRALAPFASHPEFHPRAGAETLDGTAHRQPARAILALRSPGASAAPPCVGALPRAAVALLVVHNVLQHRHACSQDSQDKRAPVVCVSWRAARRSTHQRMAPPPTAAQQWFR